MSNNVTIDPNLLPNSLRLPPHLSAHKYFFVCTLTVAAWDTLVLTPRSWKLLKSDGWPILKNIFIFLRFLMPAEFTVVGMSSSTSCSAHVQPTHCLRRGRFLRLRLVEIGKSVLSWPQHTLSSL
jgi:hypothetical protein